MKFRTEIKAIDIPVSINHKHKLFLIGSCFSDNIAERLNYFKFECLSNPFGILYNPISINKAIDSLINDKLPKESSFVRRDDLWHHFDYHGDMSGEYALEVLDKIKVISRASREFLISSDFVFITYGTSIVYKRKDTGAIVANNHKFPSDFFVKSRLSINEITDSTTTLIERLKSLNPNVKIVFTISPVRHIKDGLVENQRSKAVLQLAVENLIDNNTTFYFPSSELLLDDLRDYRFYAKDLVHPSDSAIDYIWEKFSLAFFNDLTKQKNMEIDKILKSINHKPFNANTNTYKEFVTKLNDKIAQFQKNNPEIKF